jgi:hypothetical protein
MVFTAIVDWLLASVAPEDDEERLGKGESMTVSSSRGGADYGNNGPNSSV